MTISINNLTFDKHIDCPVCKKIFIAKAVKSNAPRTSGKDSDFFINYKGINPYFYDVWICPNCGYSSLKVDFTKLRPKQAEKVLCLITPKWRVKEFPDIYTVEIAIERYKLALLNAVMLELKNSTKAMICLKIAWMYRLLEKDAKEIVFLQKAYEAFKSAYFNEDLPVYGMQKSTLLYLLGELSRRTNNYEQSLRYFSEVLVESNAPSKIKDLAYDMKNLIKESKNR